MPLKSNAQNPLDYLNKLLEDNGFEIVIPDDKDKKENKTEKKDNKKTKEDKK